MENLKLFPRDCNFMLAEMQSVLNHKYVYPVCSNPDEGTSQCNNSLQIYRCSLLGNSIIKTDPHAAKAYQHRSKLLELRAVKADNHAKSRNYHPGISGKVHRVPAGKKINHIFSAKGLENLLPVYIQINHSSSPVSGRNSVTIAPCGSMVQRPAKIQPVILLLHRQRFAQT